MATVTVLTAERMLEIEAKSITTVEVIDGELILTLFDESQINAGSVLPTPPSITGSRASGAALANLLAAMHTKGYIVNNTTA